MPKAKAAPDSAIMSQPCDIIAEHVQAGLEARKKFFAGNSDAVRQAALALARCLASGRKILLCGNGGSAADCQHLAAEFVNRFLFERPALPAIALTVDSSALTAIGNDRAFDVVFSRQVEALGATGDCLIAISTSGNSANVLAAIAAGRQKEMTVIGLTGAGGGKMAVLCDWLLAVPHAVTPVIQEIHLAIGHLLCRLTDYYLFENPAELASAGTEV